MPSPKASQRASQRRDAEQGQVLRSRLPSMSCRNSRCRQAEEYGILYLVHNGYRVSTVHLFCDRDVGRDHLRGENTKGQPCWFRPLP